MIFEPSNPKEQVLARLFCGKLYLIITFICWVLLLFEFTEIGIWTYNFILNLIKDAFSTFELSLWIFIDALKLSWIIFNFFIIVYFTFTPIYLFLFYIYFPIIKILMLLLKSLNLIPKFLDDLFTYEKWKTSQLDSIKILNQTNNSFDQDIVNDIDKLNSIHLNYLIKKNTIEYVNAYSKFQLDTFNNKISNNYLKLNFFLRFLGNDPFEFTDGCKHGFAFEIYCSHCHKNAEQQYFTLTEFIRKYKAKASKNKKKKEIKKKSFINQADLRLLDLQEPFTLSQLKEKRNIALKQNHPDLVSSMSKDIQNFAKTQTQEIIQAYNRLEKFTKKS
jgi:hypothetical protein